MASTIKSFLPLGWDDVPEGQAIVKSATGVVGGVLASSSSPQSIRVNYSVAAPVKAAGHASLGVAAWPGDGQFRVTHSQGNTDFAVQVQRINSILLNGTGPDPVLNAAQVSVSHVTVTSTYIDIWFLESGLAGFQIVDVDFFLTLLPY